MKRPHSAATATVGNIGTIHIFNASHINIINDLHLYVTLLNHENCMCLITQWSGGGQIASYFGNKNIKIIYYFVNNQDHYYNYVKNYIFNIENDPNYYDFFNPLGIKRIFYKNIEELYNSSIL